MRKATTAVVSGWRTLHASAIPEASAVSESCVLRRLLER